MPSDLNASAVEQMVQKYGDRARHASEQIELWRSGAVPFAHPDTVAALVERASPDLLFDSFWRLLPFGTGGRRGPVGYGPNRFNPSVVAITVQGHCQYLRTKFGAGALSVVVANDVRVFNDAAGTYAFLEGGHPLLGVSSRTLAQFASEIYAGNDIRVVIAGPDSPTAVMTTPM